ncbi:MAG: type II toxin-antitoxin system prevent-host-death family antitoxin [Patescibacteria group bacterium]
MAKITLSSENVGLREFRENTGKYIAALKKGKKFTIFKHSKPIFAVVPAKEVEYDLDELDGPGWTDLDLTKIRKGGVPAEEVLAALKQLHGQGK